RVGIMSAHRKIFGRAVDQPERKQPYIEADRVAAAECNVVLEGVDQLMAENVVRLFIHTRQRHDYALLQALGDAARAFSDEAANDVCLLEVCIIRIKNDGLLFAELAQEGLRMPRIPPLGHASGIPNSLLFLRIIVDAEVLRLEHLESEFVVLNLISAEVLSVGRPGKGQREDSDEKE